MKPKGLSLGNAVRKPIGVNMGEAKLVEWTHWNGLFGRACPMSSIANSSKMQKSRVAFASASVLRAIDLLEVPY
jgi:hypothetical protein